MKIFASKEGLTAFARKLAEKRLLGSAGIEGAEPNRSLNAVLACIDEFMVGMFEGSTKIIGPEGRASGAQRVYHGKGGGRGRVPKESDPTLDQTHIKMPPPQRSLFADRVDPCCKTQICKTLGRFIHQGAGIMALKTINKDSDERPLLPFMPRPKERRGR